MFDYKLIEALAMVSRDGGFDKAANTLCITQSAVFQRGKLLEELTGRVFMVRTSLPRATSAGQKLLKHYLQVKRLEDELLGDIGAIGDTAHEEFSSLAVAINADSLAFWLLEAIQPF